MKPLDHLLYVELTLFFIHNCFWVFYHLQVKKNQCLNKNSKKVVLKFGMNTL